MPSALLCVQSLNLQDKVEGMSSFIQPHISKNLYSTICRNRLNKLEQDQLLDQFFRDIFMKEYRYEFFDSPRPNTSNFIRFWNIGNKTFFYSVEKFVNILHFYKVNRISTPEGIDAYLKKEIFSGKSHEEWMDNFNSNISTLQDKLGEKFIDLLQQLFPKISNFIKDNGDFHPAELYIIEAFDSFTGEVQMMLDFSDFFGFGPTGFVKFFQIIHEDWKNQQRDSPDILYLCSFTSFVLVFAKYYVDNKEKTRQLFGLFVRGVKNPTYLDGLQLAKREKMNFSTAKMDVTLFDKTGLVKEDIPDEIDSKWKKKDYFGSSSAHNGFQTSLEFHQNMAVKDSIDCPRFLRNCLTNSNPQKKLEDLASQIREDQTSRHLVDENITRFINFELGLYVEYTTRDGVNFLVGIFPIRWFSLSFSPKESIPGTKEFIIWVAKNIMFDNDLLVRKFKSFEAACALSAEKTKNALYYRKNKGHDACIEDCGNFKCRLSDPTEKHIKLIFLRFLLEGPSMKFLSTAAAHLAKHGGGNQRLKMLRGEDLPQFCAKYYALATSMIAPEPILDNSGKVFDNNKWLEKESKKFRYSFSPSGNITITCGLWKKGKKAIMAYIAITGNDEIYLKSLINENPKDEKQAITFKWKKKYWENQAKKKR